LYDPEENSFCCLGVLCDLYIKDHSESVTWSFGWLFHLRKAQSINAAEGYLPGEVIDWADLQDSCDGDLVVYEDDGTKIELTELNDTGASFRKIARYIKSSIDPEKEEESENDYRLIHENIAD
jgi:hypothetical protein